MSKLFNAQNRLQASGGGVGFQTFLLYFTDQYGNFRFYRYNPDTGESRSANINELLMANKIFVSYSYLGGINICDYALVKTSTAIEVNFYFSLNSIVSESGFGTFWNMPKAAFMIKGYSLEPIKEFGFSIYKNNPNVLESIYVHTFSELSFGGGFYSDFGSIVMPTPPEGLLLSLREKELDLVVSRDVQAFNRLVSDIYHTSTPEAQSFRAGIYTSIGEENVVYWSSSASEIAFVNNDGTILGVAPGTAIITARFGEETAICTVTVVEELPEEYIISNNSESSEEGNISVYPDTLTLAVGGTYTLIASVVGSEETEFKPNVISMVAAFICFTYEDNVWYKNLYLILAPASAFNIEVEPASQTKAQKIKLSGSNLNYGSLLFSNLPVEYYGLDNNNTPLIEGNQNEEEA